jgi:SNF2 family DNA or RNA helicase
MENRMNNLFLIWDLEITPSDKNIGIIKSKLNLKELKHIALMNQDVYNFFAGKKICPEFTKDQQEYINLYYLDIKIDGYQVQTRFIEITNTMLLTDNITCSVINSAFSRHFINFHDITSKNDTMFSHRMDKMVELMETKDFYDLTVFDIPIKTKLFNYQTNNINWMIKRELERPSYYISSQARLIHFPDGRIYNYLDRKFIKENELPLITINGGIIADEVGKGKTIQMLCLCLVRNIPTLILTPNHLKNHWEKELEKHFRINPNIQIETFDDFKIDMLADKQRLIVDELHILYSDPSKKELYNKLCSTKIDYKWGLTATPFACENSIHKITQYLTDYIFYHELFERYMYYENIFVSLFKRNVERNINDELILPQIHYHNHLLEFTNIEQNAYIVETTGRSNSDNITLRKICCDILMNVKEDNQVMTEKDFIISFLKVKESKVNEEQEKLVNLEADFERIVKENNPELVDNLRHYESLIREQKKLIDNLERPVRFLKNQLIEEKICSIGMCDSEDDIQKTYAILTECNHYFCVPCLELALKTKQSCPYCRSSKIKYITISNNVVIPYSSKIMKLLEIIKSVPRQFIIFTQFGNIITKLISILNKEDITANSFSILNIEAFRNKEIRVLILSSKDEACGLDLSFVSDIIIFEPIYYPERVSSIGNYVKDVEKQIVGRIYRINQISECNVHRLMIKDTIEEQIYGYL